MKIIKKISIDPTSNFVCNYNLSMQDIIKRLNEIDQKFILLINDEKKFVGTLTDGDLRRAMLHKNISIQDKIKKYMNKSPYIGKPDEHNKNKKKLDLINLHMPFLPIVDDNKFLVEVLIGSKESAPIDTALILAGGKGSRLGNLTKITPKPLLDIGGESILKKILKKLEKEGFKYIYISIHYLSSKFEKFFEDFSSSMTINLIYEPYALGTAGSIGLLPTSIDDNILVMNGDILTNVNFENLISMHQKNNYDITIAAALNKIKVEFGIIEYSKNYKFEKINEKPVLEHFINAGLYCISKSVVNLVSKNQHMDMPKLIEISKSIGQKIGVFPMHEDWIDLGTPKDFNSIKDKEIYNEK
ncbi:sugar phosphate nucleotidyltransferase [Alphaproteobacteria bacterium]|nr:sugar phosphate nucleotidyltransferase [Alphaproteobacteria bacterium]